MACPQSAEPTPWGNFYIRWASRAAPQRPHASACAALRTTVQGQTDRVLLLGVTPELSDFAGRTLAIDWSRTSLAHIWPGNDAARMAVRANWLQLPVASGSASAAVGDGSFNCLRYPDEYRCIFRELTRALRPGATVAVRSYLTPDAVESVEDACADAPAGSIHGLKWRIANALAGRQSLPNVSARSIREAFNSGVPDRPALQQATGWTVEDIEQIDAYADLTDVFSFPTAAQIRSLADDYFVHVRLEPSGDYELAERCPILVMQVPR
jgi:hypothetical protein